MMMGYSDAHRAEPGGRGAVRTRPKGSTMTVQVLSSSRDCRLVVIVAALLAAPVPNRVFFPAEKVQTFCVVARAISVAPCACVARTDT